MYQAIRTEEALKAQLQTILESRLRNELGKRSFETLLSAERGAVMDNIQASLDREARKYGAQIIDVRIKRTDLPEGQSLQSAYQRMQSAQQQQAIAIDAEGQKEAQIIRAEADAKQRKSTRKAMARMRISTISTGRCSPIGGPSSRTARMATVPPPSCCRPTMIICATSARGANIDSRSSNAYWRFAKRTETHMEICSIGVHFFAARTIRF
jgi:hypothetical protein